MPVKWNRKGELQITEAFKRSVGEVALLVEGQAKVNITRNGQVDTGFMRAAVYTDAEGISTYTGADEKMAPKIQAPKDGAVVVAGANYSFWQEEQQSFLYRAVEQSGGGNADGAIEKHKV